VAKTILFVFDNDSKNFGEIKLAETRAEAERLLESLLDAGCREGQIRAFAGDEVPMRLTYRAVVSLGEQVGAESDRVSVASDDEDPESPTRREEALPTSGFSSLFRPAYQESDKA